MIHGYFEISKLNHGCERSIEIRLKGRKKKTRDARYSDKVLKEGFEWRGWLKELLDEKLKSKAKGRKSWG